MSDTYGRPSAATAIALCLGLATAAPASASEAQAAPDPRAVIAASQAVAPGGIHELRMVELGGVRQWISVRGNDPANPILLFIHGGPGSPMMPESWTFQRPWEDFFTVVQWDQRGAGKSFASQDGADVALSVERIQADAEELIDLLRREHHQDKVFVMGHSWGSIVGLRVARHRPEWLYAYIGVGQVVNGRRNEEVGYQQTLAEARARGNVEAVKELEAIAPYPEPSGATPLEKTIIERKWDVALGGMVHGKSTDDADQVSALSPDYTDKDLAATPIGEMKSVVALMPDAAATDFDGVTQYRTPIFIFAGAHDRTTPATVAKAYFDRIQAPEKRFFRIERAAHYVVNEAPGEVLVDLVNYIRPLARP
jgi:pimeloyl-ACP methyl ester carboxylesterase